MTSLEHLTYATEHARQEWRRSFEYHLDVVPPLIEVIVWMTLPSIPVSRGGSRFDRLQITGDNALRDLGDVVVSSEAAVADARILWAWLVNYLNAVTGWLNVGIPVPWAPILGPSLDAKPNPDPFLARGAALLAIGWLIDNADRVYEIPELEEHTDVMFNEIRHLRGKYGVFPRPRRQLERCDTCGYRSVVFMWADGPNGSPKPVRVGRCKTCGETYEVAPAVVRLPNVTLSEACADGAHADCSSVHCGCVCGHRSTNQQNRSE